MICSRLLQRSAMLLQMHLLAEVMGFEIFPFVRNLPLFKAS